MAPRAPKPKASTPGPAPDDASSVASLSPLKPKASKVEKKPKAARPKAEKIEKVDKALKAEKVEKVVKVKSGAEKDEKVVKEKKETAVKKDAVVKKEKDAKEKVKAVTGDEAEKLIVAYLKEQNRPYSATEVSANLHGKVTKTVADKLLKELEQSGAIMGKASNGEKKPGEKKGGQWVFWCKQDPADAATPEELAAMDATISTLRETTLPPLKSTLKSLSSKLSVVLSAPTTADLNTLVSNLQASNAEKRERVQGFRDGGVQMVTREQAEAVEKEARYWAARKKARKECFLNLEGLLLDQMTREEIWEK
ncbi:Homologous-pairing protein, partial [Lachnellula suecica]